MFHLSFPVSVPVSYISGGRLVAGGGWIHSERVIDSFEVIIGLEGEVFIQQDEEKYVVRPGSVLILLPGCTHRGYQASAGEVSFNWFHFSLRVHELLGEEHVRGKLMIMIGNPDSLSSEYCLLPEFMDLGVDDKVNLFFNQLLHFRKTACYTNIERNYVMTGLLIQLTQNYIQQYSMQNKPGAQSRTFEYVLEWIRLHQSESLTLERVAAQFNYNPDYFSRMFKKKTNVNFIEHLHRLRITTAKLLLHQSNLKVYEIAGQVGYEDEKYFLKVFKRFERVTPQNYRNAFYGIHQNLK